MNLRYLNLSLTPITGRSLRALAEKESLRCGTDGPCMDKLFESIDARHTSARGLNLRDLGVA